MKVSLAGLPVEIQPPDLLTHDDRSTLERAATSPLLPGSTDRVLPGLCRVTLSPEPPWVGPADIAAPGEPTLVTSFGDEIRIGAPGFRAVVNPSEGTASHFREGGSSRSLEATLRVLLACRLPFLHGLPLHAAAVAMDRAGVVFYGVSGAGKSTLSSLSPFRVLSDEAVVAIATEGRWEVASSGFWGPLDQPCAPRGYLPLAGLFQLRKEPSTLIARLSPREAFLSLLPVVTIPDSAPLWRLATSALATLVEAVPVFSLGWSPESPPWEEVGEAIRRGSVT